MKFRFIFSVLALAAIVSASCGKEDSSKPAEFKGEISSARAVDMGTGVSWSGINLGAGSPEQAGGYYAWAEPLKDTTNFILDTYVHYSTILTVYLKYYAGDKAMQAEAEDDPATHFWGPEYRMPSRSEFQDLIEACDWTFASYKGKAGWVATSKTTGNSIFFPLAGYRSGMSMKRLGSRGVYWTGELTSVVAEESGTNKANQNLCWTFGISSSGTDLGYAERYIGASVRPVSNL